MDQAIRNKLRNVVTQCRKLLEDAVAQVLQGQFGIYATGKKDEVHVDDDAKMKHLSDEDRSYRKDILDHLEHVKALGYKPTDSLAQLVREIAFTHLNRFCAYKMMEARSLIRESVSKGVKSQGFLFYLADHEDDEKRASSGQQDVAYRHFLNWLGGTLSEEIGVLFNPHDSANRLYPPQRVLEDVLDILNDDTLADIWTQDETIGWVYQYFTPKELRDQVRKESPAPRNSYELAFRNQFFTPRYVVEFLTDNTLGRIWYEMRKGDTKLKDQCRYMVRRPTEIFLKDREQSPKDATEGKDDLSQEELLKLPVHVPHRPKKDPRELKILDPACGSGHFLLYCFDLLLTIYEEAYSDPELGKSLQQDYPTLDALKRDVPRLILAHNLHGIDIDLRASQIAALALWLRCQRAYQEMGLKKDRPKITRSNFVCAEPMPGEPAMLKEFVGQIEPRLLGQLVEVVFDKMKLAGEAGSLLKIEEDIRTAVASAKQQWEAGPIEVQKTLFDRSDPKPTQKRFNLSGVTDEEFFNEAEAKVVEALRTYAEKATNGQRLQRRLFTEDAVRGFAFVDVCQRRYDVIVMNPPFGEPVRATCDYMYSHYPASKHDLFAAFCDRCFGQLAPQGIFGEISSRVGFFLKSFADWRNILIQERSLRLMVDLGADVLDTATVEACCYIVAKEECRSVTTVVIRLLTDSDKATRLETAVHDLSSACVFAVTADHVRHLPLKPLIYWVPKKTLRKLSHYEPLEPTGAVVRQGLGTGDNPQFIRAFWEVPPEKIAGFRCRTPQDVRNQLSGDYSWAFHVRSGSSQPWYSPITLVIEWSRQGEKLKNHWRSKGESPSRYIPSEDLYFRPGLSWTLRHFRLVPYIVPAGCIPSASRYMAFPNEGYESTVLAFSASILATAFMRFYGEKFEWPKHLVDTFKRLPYKAIDGQLSELLGARVKAEVLSRRNFYRNREPFLDFTVPSIVQSWAIGDGAGWNWFTLLGDDVEEKIAESFGLDRQELKTLARDMNEAVQMRLRTADSESDGVEGGDEESDGESELDFDLSPRGIACDLVSWLFGVSVGRWDVRYSLLPSVSPDLPDVFSPNSAFPLGSLLGSDGRPAKCLSDVERRSSHGAVETEDVSIRDDAIYPLNVFWDGILVDDIGHPNDVAENIRRILEVVWPSEYEDKDGYICKSLKVQNIREYFRKSGKGGFWSDHISRYSMSRRKAPIYWLLQSSKKSYSLWLYYHRLDKDLLFKALVNYVEPKVRLEVNRLDSLRAQKAAAGDSGKAAKKIDKDIEKQEDFISELQYFEDKLRRAADLHLEPDLNDGVVLNIAPLHELVPWKEAKSYWNELLEGKYEWSSIGKQLREKGLVK